MSSRPVIRFGVFELDRRTGELRKQGVKLRLRDQSFQVLALLLERPGHLVTRDELRSTLWSADTFVDFDRGLNKAVNRLREVLGDAAESPRYVETIPKHGYRFIAPVDDPGAEVGALAPSHEHRDGLATAQPGLPSRLEGTPHQPRSVRLWWLLAGVAVVAGTASALYTFTRPRAGLTERDNLVLADIENRTGDRAFDDTLKMALAIDLEQSPFLRILSEQEIAARLRMMHRTRDQRLTSEVAREVCQRAGAKAVLEGSLAALGREYVLGLIAVNCWTGETLAREQVRTSRAEDVLGSLDNAAADLRARLGESLSSIQRFDARVHDILSTSSLEAFQAYTNGERMVLRGRPATSFFKRAIELDPEFAYAHAALGLLYGTQGEATRSAESTRRAYDLRERVTEWERYFITAQYHLQVTGDIDRVLSVCESWIQQYPRDRTAHNRLAFAYRQLGRYDDAMREYEQARRLGGDHPVDLLLQARTCINLNHFDEAERLIREALTANPEDGRFRRPQYLLAFLLGDQPRMERLAALLRNAAVDEQRLVDADTAAYFGRLSTARELTRAAIASARGNELNGRASLMLANDALREALVGNTEAAQRQAGAALGLAPGWDARVLAALALARTGDVEQARGLADRLTTDFPAGTHVQHYWVPTIRAEIELHHEDVPRALAYLADATAYELADPSIPGAPALYPTYVLGLAHLRARHGAAAAAEFLKVLAHAGLVGNHPVGALAHLGLARAYALSGEGAAAHREYQALLKLWKDADRDVPAFMQASAEYR